MPSVTSNLRAFGEFRVDAQNRTLWRGEGPVALTPKAFEVLLLLIDHSGEVVSKDELMQTVWPDSFVEESNLTQTVFMLRKALGETSEQRYVLTVQGRGYRFASEVKSVPANGHVWKASSTSVVPSHDLQMVAPKQSPGKRIRKQAVLTFGLVALVALGLSAWLMPALLRPTNAFPPIHSIAVLPLANLSGDPMQDYFADAMTDELITDLAKVGALRVTSRTTIALYKHTNKKLPEIARELNVDGIVEGSIVRSGQRLRVTAQLIRGAVDQHLWAESYDRDFGDALQLQSDLARAITEQVRAQLTPHVKAQFGTSRAVNPEAYESYLRGRFHLYNESFTDPRALKQAKESFEEAIRGDPTFSPAYSGAAETYVWMALFGQQSISSAEAFKLTREAISKALELDPNNGEAYDALGILKWHADNDWKAAEQAFNESIALSPSYSCAHEDRAAFLALMGRRDEALAELEESTILDPGPDSAGTSSAVFIQLRDWGKLLDSARQQLASNANDWLTHANLGLGYEGTGKFPEAIAEYEKAIELSNGGDLNAVASLGHAYAVAGRRYDAEKILHDLEQRALEGKASPYLPATIYAGLGEKDKALELIEKAYREKSLDVAWIFKPDLRTDNLRSDPRFKDLLHRTGLAQ
jgi:TolB-like protein/DNA-binding winged helix-turn-helix (wHTH) protein/Tfp pilus assembly protein PilF